MGWRSRATARISRRKSVAHPGCLDDVRADELQDLVPAHQAVAGQVDEPHRAAAQLAEDLIIRVISQLGGERAGRHGFVGRRRPYVLAVSSVSRCAPSCSRSTQMHRLDIDRSTPTARDRPRPAAGRRPTIDRRSHPASDTRPHSDRPDRVLDRGVRWIAMGLVPGARQILGGIDHHGGVAAADAPERKSDKIERVLDPPDRMVSFQRTQLLVRFRETWPSSSP